MFNLFHCSSFRDSTYGEGGEGSGEMLPDDYPTGGGATAQRYPGDLNGIETTIDQIFEGISHFSRFGLIFK